MPYTIRPAVYEDAAGLARVRVETWRSAYAGLMPRDVLDALDMDKEMLRWQDQIATLPPERWLFTALAWQAGQPPEIAGFSGGGPHRDPSVEYPNELYAIYVLPHWQGAGIGRALVSAGAAWLRQRGQTHMILYVLRDNAPSRRFYERLGGQVVCEKSVAIRGVELPEVGYGYDLTKCIAEEK
jgi:ribosomal protein S18 acetylase RimI-like enzyme